MNSEFWILNWAKPPLIQNPKFIIQNFIVAVPSGLDQNLRPACRLAIVWFAPLTLRPDSAVAGLCFSDRGKRSRRCAMRTRNGGQCRQLFWINRFPFSDGGSITPNDCILQVRLGSVGVESNLVRHMVDLKNALLKHMVGNICNLELDRLSWDFGENHPQNKFIHSAAVSPRENVLGRWCGSVAVEIAMKIK